MKNTTVAILFGVLIFFVSNQVLGETNHRAQYLQVTFANQNINESDEDAGTMDEDNAAGMDNEEDDSSSEGSDESDDNIDSDSFDHNDYT